jgi:hypothetical protein
VDGTDFERVVTGHRPLVLRTPRALVGMALGTVGTSTPVLRAPVAAKRRRVQRAVLLLGRQAADRVMVTEEGAPVRSR